MASAWTHGSCTTVLNNDRSSLEWGRDYREDPVWQWSWHSKGKRGLTSDRHPWFLIILSHCWLLQSISPHTSPYLYPPLCRMPAPSFPLHILKCPCLSFPAFSLSRLTDLHLPKPLSNKIKMFGTHRVFPDRLLFIPSLWLNPSRPHSPPVWWALHCCVYTLSLHGFCIFRW